jgi:hypothetical protein
LDYARLEKAGIRKIIYPVFKDDEENGGLYFVNSRFHTIRPALEQLIAEFDYGKVELCAWMIARSFKWADKSLMDYRYENSTRRMVPKLDLFNPSVVQHIMEVYRELASRKINCILIQDDFAIRYNEGFSSWGKAKFSEVTQVPAREKLMIQKDSPHNLNWNRIKVKHLSKLLKLIVDSCKRVNSGIKIGLNIYYETPVYSDRAEAWYGHDLRKIMDAGVDYVYLMAYHRQIKEEMKFDEEKNRVFFKELVEKAAQICREKLIVKVQIRDYKTGERIPAEEVKVYLNLVPRQVRRVCFTPVTLDDLDYLEGIIGSAAAVVPRVSAGKTGK